MTISEETRLHPFARSWLYNATAMRGALWWFRQSYSVTLIGACHIQQQSHSVNYANQHSPFARRRHDFRQVAARHFKLHPPLSFGKSFMKIRSAVPENGCLIFLTDRKKNKKKQKQKKNKKTSAKHICIRLLLEDGCVNQQNYNAVFRNEPCQWTGHWMMSESGFEM